MGSPLREILQHDTGEECRRHNGHNVVIRAHREAIVQCPRGVSLQTPILNCFICEDITALSNDITKLFYLSITFSFSFICGLWVCRADKTSRIVLSEVLYSPSLSRTLSCSVVAKTQSSAEAQNKPAALITEQFPKLCNNNSMPTVSLSPQTSGCSSDSLLNVAWSIQNQAAIQKTTEGAFVW